MGEDGEAKPALENEQEEVQEEAVADKGAENWAARFREAMNRQLGVADEEVLPSAGGDAEDAGSADAAEVDDTTNNAESDQKPDVNMPFHCCHCLSGFASEEELPKHYRENLQCLGVAWQAAVTAKACLPGAGSRCGSTLWCPACPDDFVGRWSGPATKAGALLRHLAAAEKAETGHHQPAHNRLLTAFVGLFMKDLPDDTSEASLQPWASASALGQLAGPLLARPCAEARRAVSRSQAEVLGPTGPAGLRQGGDGVASVFVGPRGALAEEGEDQDDVAASAPEEVGSMRLKILGLDLTVESGASGLYEDVEKACDEMLAQGAGPPLPAGGAAALRSFDLTLSSDEEEQPVQGNAETPVANVASAALAADAPSSKVSEEPAKQPDAPEPQQHIASQAPVVNSRGSETALPAAKPPKRARHFV